MSAVFVSTGTVDAAAVGERWVLVLGGVTRVGNRRARRAVSEALDAGFEVIWFDGFEENDPDSSQPSLGSETDRAPVVVEFGEAETNTLAGRLRSAEHFQSNRVTKFLWRSVLRRLGTVLRPRACWTAIRSDVKRLAEAAPPAAIVFGDDYSTTSAWYCARLWPNAPLSTQLTVNSE